MKTSTLCKHKAELDKYWCGAFKEPWTGANGPEFSLIDSHRFRLEVSDGEVNVLAQVVYRHICSAAAQNWTDHSLVVQ